nr:hypothetical protein [Tanacetum cinerariifolium]
MEQQGDDVASLWPWDVFKVLVSCYRDVMEVLRIKSLHKVTVVKVRINAAKLNLVLLKDDQDSAYKVDASKVPMLKPGVETIIAPTTVEEKAQKRLELKARRTLLIGIPNEHQLKFNSIKDAKLLLQAVEKSSEVLDQTFDWVQNLISQLEIHGECISQEDVNQKFLRSVSQEWNTHTIVLRNKSEIDTLSLDDHYNNLKIYEPEVKGTSSSNANTQNVEFVSSNNTNNRNGVVNTAHGVTTISTQATAVNSTTIDKLSDATIRFDKSKVECYNCHKREHFARESRAPRSQDTKHKESKRMTVPVETPASAALVSCDRLGGYDWSDQAEDGLTNFALMAYSSTSSNFEDKGVIDSGCSRHMTGNMSYLTDYEEIDKGFVAFGGNPKGGKIIGRAPGKEYILLPLWTADLLISLESKSSQDDGFQPSSDDGKKVDEDPRQEKMPALEDISTFNLSSNQEDADEEADMNNMDITIQSWTFRALHADLQSLDQVDDLYEILMVR